MKADMHTYLFSRQLLDRAEDEPRLASRPVEPLTPEETWQRAAASGAQAIAIQGWPFLTQALCEEQNRLIGEALKALPGKVMGFCTVLPAAGEAALQEAARRLDEGFAGIGMLDPWGQGFALDDPWFQRLCDLCEELQRPLSLYTSLSVGEGYPGKSGLLPNAVLQLAASRPGLMLLLPHYGGGLPFYAMMPEVAKTLKNTWFDTAPDVQPLRPQATACAAQCLANGHLLYGSGIPLWDATACEEATCTELPAEWEGLL